MDYHRCSVITTVPTGAEIKTERICLAKLLNSRKKEPWPLKKEERNIWTQIGKTNV